MRRILFLHSFNFSLFFAGGEKSNWKMYGDQCTARQTWDASEFVGQKAFLRLVDAYSYGLGHINFDDLRGDINFVYCHIYLSNCMIINKIRQHSFISVHI